MRYILVNYFPTSPLKHNSTVCSESRCELIKVLELMSLSDIIGLKLFNFIRKHFLHICIRKVAVHL
jgi:hypothetical protein